VVDKICRKRSETRCDGGSNEAVRRNGRTIGLRKTSRYKEDGCESLALTELKKESMGSEKPANFIIRNRRQKPRERDSMGGKKKLKETWEIEPNGVTPPRDCCTD